MILTFKANVPSTNVSANLVAPLKTAALKSRSGQRGHPRPKAPEISLEQDGRLWTANVMWILNVSHSALIAGEGIRYPERDGYDGRRPYWNTKTIRNFKEGEDRAWAAKKAFLESIGLEAQRPSRRSDRVKG